jgi:transaldolase/glucose-6-phosphate isomerase
MATATRRNPLLELVELGQSIWYDYIRRSLISSGELERLISEDGLRGVTANPSIFEKAITGSTDYREAIAELGREPSLGVLDPKAIYERLAIEDVQAAADVFRPVYEATERGDGYVSLEVSPTLGHDTEGTIAEAERLWSTLARENVMIKVPAAAEGMPAIRELVARGLNINITLLFSLDAYEQVAEAYIAGLEQLARERDDLSGIASVASFFVSRIDTVVDARLDELGGRARELRGKVAIANAKVAYQRYKEIFAGERWERLAAKGARKQRLLWASTGTKNPALSDVYYVEALVGPETVDTVPPATFEAFRDHGRARPALEEGADEARETLSALTDLGISLDEVTAKLLEDGIALFQQAFDKLFAAIAQAVPPQIERQRLSLPAEMSAAVDEVIEDWRSAGKVRRLWSRDATLWTGADESQWLGWLGVIEDQLAHSEQFRFSLRRENRELLGSGPERIARDVTRAGFARALLLGMGGSSLAPEMLSLTFPTAEGHPALRILDSTDPAQIRAREEEIDLARTIFIVSSKSGTTLEPNIFYQYFFERVKETVGAGEAARRFIAITDPGSKLEQIAEEAGFRAVAHGLKSIGGRYSALSDFGIVPGAIMGVDVHELLDRAERMAHACAACVPASDNPGLVLGAIIGVCANRGRDKLTLVTSPEIADFGAWLEQLLAESTGKQGRGVIPIDREPIGAPESYGEDRLFVYVRLESGPDDAQDVALDALEQAGQPVVTIRIDDPYDLGGELFRWEFATAVAGAVIAINPFDQPDVEASKVATQRLTAEYEQKGALPAEDAIFESDGIALFGDRLDVAEPTLETQLAAHLGRLTPGDYFALLAYVQMTDEHERILTDTRRLVRDRKRVATCVGFGPRFLHSTGQAYKGGPNSGVFLQITCDDAEDLPVPGQRYTFGVVKAAQARGDFQVLAERGRRALRVHLDEDVAGGLEAVRKAIEEVL